MSPDEQLQAVNQLWFGETPIPGPEALEVAWKAVKTIAAGDRVLSAPERISLIARMSALLTPAAVIEQVLAWDERSARPEQLFADLPIPPGARRATGAWIVYNGLSVAIADRELAPGELAMMIEVARALSVDEGTVQAFYQLVHEEADLRRRRIAALAGDLDAAFRR